MPELTRRDVLRLAAIGATSVALPRLAHAADSTPTTKPVRLAFIGVGDRGTALLKQTLLRTDVVIPAVCDTNPAAAKRAQDLVEKSTHSRPDAYTNGPDDWRHLLKRSDLDAVLIATPQELHTVMAVESMKARLFVGSEVPACCTIDECWQLVETARQTGMRYMMLENYLYTQFVMQVQRMADAGLFGELTCASGAYIHEIRHMRFNPDGSLTWRGHNVLSNLGIVYPTHAIGPCCRWLGVNRTDRLTTLVSMDTKPLSNHQYAVDKFGADSPQSKINFLNGDNNLALVRTVNGRMIEVRYDTASPRPTGMGQYALQGTKGSFESSLGQRMVYLEGHSKPETWEPLDTYAKDYQHPYWQRHGSDATAAGHSGSDYFVIADFINSIRTNTSAIDVYDAVTWSSIRPLSEQSIKSGYKPVAIPDFKSDKPE